MPERHRILIVDENPQDRQAVRRALAAESFRYEEVEADVLEAESVAQARAALAGEQFSCLFLAHSDDVLDLLHEVRERGLSTPVVVLTGRRDEPAITALMQAGAIDYVPKSELTPDLVARSLRAALHFQRAQREKRTVPDAVYVRDRAIAAASNGIVIADPHRPDAPIVYANPAFLALSGYSEAEIIGRNCRFLQGEETDPAAVAALRDAIREERAVQVMILNYKKDGTSFWNEVTVSPVRDAQGVVTHFVGIQTDITDRIAAEREREELLSALASGQEQLQAVQDGMTDGLIVSDKDGNILTLNQVARRLHDYGRVDLVGRHLSELPDAFTLRRLDGSVLPLDQWPLARALRGERFTDYELQVTRRDTGRTWTASYAGAPILNTRGRADRVMVTLRDITERKESEAALAAAYEREHRIAEALQRSLLNKPPQDTLGRLEVETIYKAAWNEAEVGGDYHDVFALDGGRLALVVGDVSGKGLMAASRTAEIKYTLRAYLREHSEPGSALTRLNTFLCEAQALATDPQDYFVVMTLIVVDSATGSARVAVAGAEPPILLRAGGGAEEVQSNGLPLGVAAKAEYDEAALHLTSGDLLLVATDGITEARRGREFLGNAGMAALAVEARSRETLAQVGQAILDGAREFAQGQLHDDICLLLARLR